jgi:hypothetical protein
MSRSRRALLSLSSAFGSSIIVCLVLIGANYTNFQQSMSSPFVFLRAFVIVIIAAWLATLPLVLLVGKPTGRRLWLLSTCGVLIGPALLKAIDLCLERMGPTPRVEIHESLAIWLTVTSISLLATALYLTSLKLFCRPTPTPSTQTN